MNVKCNFNEQSIYLNTVLTSLEIQHKKGEIKDISLEALENLHEAINLTRQTILENQSARIKAELQSLEFIDTRLNMLRKKIYDYISNAQPAAPNFVSLEDSAKIPAVPLKGINCGLPNVGNSCWINSAIKFMAITTYFDSLLNHSHTIPAEHKEFHRLLRVIIASLRQLPGGVLDDAIYKSFIEEGKKLFSALKNAQQEDAFVFFNTLQQEWGWPEKFDEPESKWVTIIKEYTLANNPAEGAVYNTNQQNRTFIEITLTEDFVKSGEKINLAHHLEASSTFQDFAGVKQIGKVILDSKTEIRSKEYYTYLPQTLLFYIKRSFVNETAQNFALEAAISLQQMAEKAYNYVEVDEKGEVHFNEYQLVRDKEGGVTDSVLSKIKIYQVCGSIVQKGTSNEGHYFAEERPKTGPVIQHNDSKCIPQNPKRQKMGEEGYILRLEFVREESLLS